MPKKPLSEITPEHIETVCAILYPFSTGHRFARAVEYVHIFTFNLKIPGSCLTLIIDSTGESQDLFSSEIPFQGEVVAEACYFLKGRGYLLPQCVIT